MGMAGPQWSPLYHTYNNIYILYILVLLALLRYESGLLRYGDIGLFLKFALWHFFTQHINNAKTAKITKKLAKISEIALFYK